MYNDKKILVVYNCCGIQKDNIDSWITGIHYLIKQKIDCDTYICISGCKISSDSKQRLLEYTEKYTNIFLFFTDTILPVNITFNKACIECSKYISFDGFFYIASDAMLMNKDRLILHKICKLHFDNNCAITSAYIDHDFGIEKWFNIPKHNIYSFFNDHLEIPIGKSCNLHCMLFDRMIFDKFNQRILPDIFLTYSTESTFSYISASLNKKFMIHNNSASVRHISKMDGSSAGFRDKLGHEFLMNNMDFTDRLITKEAYDCGFGYEEVNDVFPHNPNCYNGNAHINPDILLEFLNKTIYLQISEFDYDNIDYEFHKIK